MSNPRRRIVRPQQPPDQSEAQRQRQLQRLRTRLEKDQKALARWVVRLKRAFHSFERLQQRVARLERQITRLEQ